MTRHSYSFAIVYTFVINVLRLMYIVLDLLYVLGFAKVTFIIFL